MPRALLVIPTLVAGTAVLMWLGEMISQRGIGNGMSIVIFASVVSGLPYGYYSILGSKKWFVFAILLIFSLLILVAIVFGSNSVNDGSRCSSPSASSGDGCTAGRTPTSR